MVVARSLVFSSHWYCESLFCIDERWPVFSSRTQALTNSLKHPISSILEGYCTYTVLFSSRMQAKMAENPSAEASTMLNTAISQSEYAVNRNMILGELGSRCAYVRYAPQLERYLEASKAIP